MVVYRKRNRSFKAVRSRHEHAKPAFERVGGDPGFVRAFSVLAARDNGRFDAVATVARPSEPSHRLRRRSVGRIGSLERYPVLSLAIRQAGKRCVTN